MLPSLTTILAFLAFAGSSNRLTVNAPSGAGISGALFIRQSFTTEVRQSEFAKAALHDPSVDKLYLKVGRIQSETKATSIPL